MDCKVNHAADIRSVAVIGAGLIGTSWATVFAAAGCPVKVFDANASQRENAMNRIEANLALLLAGCDADEAWALYADGYASAEDIDQTVRAGLGLRWSLIGPFETIDLNAPKGIVDYAERLEPFYHQVAQSRRDPQRWPAEAIQRAKQELPQQHCDQPRASREKKRDQWLLTVKKTKRES